MNVCIWDSLLFLHYFSSCEEEIDILTFQIILSQLASNYGHSNDLVWVQTTIVSSFGAISTCWVPKMACLEESFRKPPTAWVRFFTAILVQKPEKRQYNVSSSNNENEWSGTHHQKCGIIISPLGGAPPGVKRTIEGGVA